MAAAALWLPAAANFAGTRWVGGVQIVLTILEFVPLLLVATVGLFFIDTDNFGPFNASGDSVSGALAASAALLLYSFLGVESAARARARSATRSARWAARVCWARSARHSCTSSVRSRSSGWSRTANSPSPARRSPTPSTR